MFGKTKSKNADIEFFTIFDSKSKTYREPFAAPNKDVVLRDFLNAFKKDDAMQKNVYLMNAEDYSLFRIGEFDLRSGMITASNAEHIINMHDLRALVEPRGIVTST